MDMLKTVRAFVVLVAIFLALPLAGYAADDFAKKYGVDIMIGGSYYNMTDINNFLADQDFIATDPEKINIGTQIGIALLYRSDPGFGWQIGHSRLFAGVPGIAEQKFKHEAILTSKGASLVSTAEQRVSGGESYILGTFYTNTGPVELSLGIGPSIYSATLERTVVLYQSAGLNAPASPSAFTDATGWSMGFIAKVGIELDFSEQTGLAFEVGGRYAKVAKLSWEDPNNQDNVTIVRMNSYSNATLPVDFSGMFAKLTLRKYFEPASGWHQTRRK